MTLLPRMVWPGMTYALQDTGGVRKLTSISAWFPIKDAYYAMYPSNVRTAAPDTLAEICLLYS